MNLLRDIQPISFLKSNTRDVIKQVQVTREPVMITVNGKVQAVVQDALSFQQTQDQIALLRILALGKKQIREGRVTDQDAFFAAMEAEDDDAIA